MLSDILPKVKRDFPEIKFNQGTEFVWLPKAKTIHFASLNSTTDIAHLLHEIGHSQLNHLTYASDISLLEMERDAWHYAINQLAPRYNISLSINDSVVQDSLDSYREWLHDRASCPQCNAVGLQSGASYRCLVCDARWTANQAKQCRLYRRLI